MKLKKPSCYAPWHHSFIHADGTIRACCVSDDILGDTKKGDTVESVWNSEHYKKIRLKLLTGLFPSGCRSCILKEQMGIRSRKDYLDVQFDHLAGSGFNCRKYQEVAPLEIFSLDISLSRKCNLRCRMCGPYNSTKWDRDVKGLIDLDSGFWKKIVARKNYQRPASDLVSFKTLFENCRKLGHLELKGGEPFLDSDQLQLLQFLLEMGRSSEIELSYVSNGTVVQDLVQKLFPQFKRVNITLSIDGTGELYKYLRGEKYSLEETIQQNILFYDSIDGVQINIHFTLSAFNIFGVADFFEWYQKLSLQRPLTWSVGTVAYPKALRVTNLPSKLRREAAKMIEQYNNKNISKIRSLLLAGPERLDPDRDLIQYIRGLDKVRGTNFLDLYKNHPISQYL